VELVNYLALGKIVVCSLISLLLAITPLTTISEEISQYITLEVYADGCVSVTARLGIVQNTSYPGYLLANATVIVESSRFNYEGFLEFYQPATVSQSTMPLYLFIEGSIETQPVGENIASTGWINFIARGGTLGNTVDISVNATRVNSTYYTGNQTITASGRVEASGYIESSGQRMDLSVLIPMLLFQIQSYLSMSNMSRYVKLETSQSISGGVAVVDFNAMVDLAGLYSMQGINISSALINATDIIKPHSSQLYLKLIVSSNSTGTSASLVIRGVEEVNVNEYIVQLAKLYEYYLNATSQIPTPFITQPQATPIPSTATLNASRLVNRFNELFEIRESVSTIKLSASGNRVELEYKSPKIIKKGATSPKETLIALYDYVKEVNSIIKPSTITPAKIKIQSSQGVKVYLHGEAPSEVLFDDLPNLEVVIEATPTTQPTTQTGVAEEKPGYTLIAIIAVVVAAVASILVLVLRSRRR
jgi:hypothetical protein